MVKIENLRKALQRLEEGVNMEPSMVVRDAVIQRFEFTFELAWKSLRDFLRQAHGVVCNSPKQCFREGFSLGLFDQETTELLLKMVDDRNETTHTYDENRITEIFKRIKTEYYAQLRKIYQITQKTTDK
ncbi:MAG TPA: nucleotidyltransferase [Caldithrix abyssi]|uniref:Nucleotidyltransferase n=1 Tax=Caldithrix abyssi TaxID=187145 RepID=A0A7V5PNX4_CALAY|nr:nucleotidyltransferase [Caldithrix abyssi]